MPQSDVVRIRLRVLVPASLGILLVVMGLNALSLTEVKEFLAPEALRNPGDLLERADRLFDATAAYLVARGSKPAR